MKRARCKGKVSVLESLEERLINSNDLCFMIQHEGWWGFENKHWEWGST